MENEKDRLEREIKVLEEAEEIVGRTGAISVSLIELTKKLKSDLEKLTRPAIKDGVLGRWTNGKITTRDACKYNDPETGLSQPFWKFIPLTIEELLPTLAQWVPWAVRWEYIAKNSIRFIGVGNGYPLSIDDGDGAEFRIPAPHRDDWETCKGEL